MNINHKELVKQIKETYPQIDWGKFEDMDRALNWELWHGPLPSNYWKDTEDGDAVEPLEHYDWQGWVQAQDDIIEVLEPLPSELWWDADCDFLLTSNPELESANYQFPCKYCGELVHREYVDGKSVYLDDTDGDCCSGNDELENENEPHEPGDDEAVWCGPSIFYTIDPRKELMHVESWKQIF